MFLCAIVSAEERHETRVTMEKAQTSAKDGTADSTKLFVFVGERVYFRARRRWPPWAFSRKYVAKYRLIECIYGECNAKKIRFKAYSHLNLISYPEYALLTVNRTFWGHRLEYRQMTEVKRTADARWANCAHHKQTGKNGREMEPRNIDFDPEDWSDISRCPEDLIPAYYPQPYFEIVGDSARCLTGFYAEELFEVAKHGVLTARGIFE